MFYTWSGRVGGVGCLLLDTWGAVGGHGSLVGGSVFRFRKKTIYNNITKGRGGSVKL